MKKKKNTTDSSLTHAKIETINMHKKYLLGFQSKEKESSNSFIGSESSFVPTEFDNGTKVDQKIT